MAEQRTLYPVSVTAKIHITNGDTDGEATYSFPLNKLPTEADMEDAIKQVTEMLPDDFRLMSRHESMMYYLRQDKGYRGPSLALSALGEGERWHDPATENTFSFRGDEDDFEEDEA
jgi:hypothetical protein